MTNNSYDFNNTIRDVSEVFDTLIANSPSFLKKLGSFGTSLNPVTGLPVVTNTKYEWIDDSLTQFSSAIASFATDGDGVTFDVADNSGFIVGSVLRFEKATGASVSELVLVTAQDVNGTTVTVTRDYGGTTGVTLVVGDITILNSTPKVQYSSATDGELHQGVEKFNYTEIFREFAQLSNTAKASASYDNYTAMAMQMKAAMVKLARKVESASLFGVPVLGSNPVAQSMGGLIHFLSQAGGNIESTGGNLSQEFINNVIEDISQKGGMLINPVILCAPTQARKLSALNTSGNNPIVYKDNVDRSLGNFVSSFVGDMPIGNGAAVAEIFVAPNMAKDKVAIIDVDSINLKVMRGLIAEDATEKGADGEKQSLTTELTLEVKNATSAHGIVTGLTL